MENLYQITATNMLANIYIARMHNISFAILIYTLSIRFHVIIDIDPEIRDGPSKRFFVTKCYYLGYGLRFKLIFIFITNDKSDWYKDLRIN